jgi:hypothetical protein
MLLSQRPISILSLGTWSMSSCLRCVFSLLKTGYNAKHSLTLIFLSKLPFVLHFGRVCDGQEPSFVIYSARYLHGLHTYLGLNSFKLNSLYLWPLTTKVLIKSLCVKLPLLKILATFAMDNRLVLLDIL